MVTVAFPPAPGVKVVEFAGVKPSMTKSSRAFGPTQFVTVAVMVVPIGPDVGVIVTVGAVWPDAGATISSPTPRQTAIPAHSPRSLTPDPLVGRELDNRPSSDPETYQTPRRSNDREGLA